MTINTLPFERRPRNTMANNLDKINELIDYINHSTITPAWNLDASATGESVTVGNSSSLKGLDVFGKSIQDGIPTLDAPVEVQIVQGINLLDVNSPNKQGGKFIMSDGSLTNSASWNVSDYIPATAGDYVLVGAGTGSAVCYAVYDSEKSFVYAASYANRATVPIAVTAAGYVRVCWNNDNVGTAQLECGTTPMPYVPYGSIGIVVGDTITPIDLQGNTLASLPDGTRDELHIDSAGRVVIDKRTGRILTPTDVSNVINLTQVTGGARWNIDVDGLTSEEIPNGSTNGFCSHTPFSHTLSIGSLGSHIFTFGGKVYYIIKGDFTASTAVTWVNSHQMTIIYPLATPQTIDLGYITPPAIPNGSVVTVSASLTPEFTLEWWVESGITDVIEDLKAYIDYRIGE